MSFHMSFSVCVFEKLWRYWSKAPCNDLMSTVCIVRGGGGITLISSNKPSKCFPKMYGQLHPFSLIMNKFLRIYRSTYMSMFLGDYMINRLFCVRKYFQNMFVRNPVIKVCFVDYL